MKVLIACEFSGRVRDKFLKKGHDAISCDLLPTDSPGPHHQGDVIEFIPKFKPDLMIAHPECTYLTNAGVCHLHKNVNRWLLLFQGAEFFKKMLNADVPMICVENPIQHKYAKQIINQDYTQIIHPWMFGHAEQKATCLWLKNLPPLVETKNVKKEMMLLPDNQRQRLHYLPPSPERWKERSKTFTGIAQAMAEQWG